jgi:hypothetical protein
LQERTAPPVQNTEKANRRDKTLSALVAFTAALLYFALVRKPIEAR